MEPFRSPRSLFVSSATARAISRARNWAMPQSGEGHCCARYHTSAQSHFSPHASSRRSSPWLSRREEEREEQGEEPREETRERAQRRIIQPAMELRKLWGTGRDHREQALVGAAMLATTALYELVSLRLTADARFNA